MSVEFTRLYKLWGATEWEWFTTFEVDLAIIQGDFPSAKALLKQMKEKILKCKGLPDKVHFTISLLQCVDLCGQCVWICVDSVCGSV